MIPVEVQVSRGYIIMPDFYTAVRYSVTAPGHTLHAIVDDISYVVGELAGCVEPRSVFSVR